MLKKILTVSDFTGPLYLQITDMYPGLTVGCTNNREKATRYNSEKEIVAMLERLETFLRDYKAGKIIELEIESRPYTEENFLMVLIRNGVTIETFYEFNID